MGHKVFKTNWAGRELTVETGKLALQAGGSVTVRYGDTLILATATISDQEREGVSYLPLMVDYEERFYAAGKIKGSRWIKREGRPSDEAILTGRLIDRSIRPLFNKQIRRDIQVVITVFSIDEKNDPDILAILGASLALGVSNIPFDGPIAGCRAVKKNGKLIINANYEERQKNNLDIVIAGKRDKINMLEGEMREISEEEALEVILKTMPEIQALLDFQDSIIKKIGQKKLEINAPDLPDEIKQQMQKILSEGLRESIKGKDKKTYLANYKTIETSLVEKFPDYKNEIEVFMEEELNRLIHKMAIEADERQDGRSLSDIRTISVETKIFPRTHGSGLFSRGDTQVASSVTLGSPGSELFLDTMELEGRKRFMHHYNFPGYSVGEVSPMRGPGRREIGHGFLAEKALKAVIPDKETFPYTILVVSETLSSNGSSSMASVCASSLALMDAGVPIKSHVAGIAIGLITSQNLKKYKILTDIQGPEDHHGDMDLKLAGTKKGLTAIQMDVKVEGITIQMLKDAFSEGKKARFLILKKLEESINLPRPDLSPYAPRIKVVRVNPEKIGKIIGPGGKIINQIIEATGTAIDIEDDGSISITSNDKEMMEKAIEWIEKLTKEAKLGDEYEGVVRTVKDFGVFVEIFPGQDGMIHKSQLRNPISVGDKVRVRVRKIDEKGRIDLALLS